MICYVRLRVGHLVYAQCAALGAGAHCVRHIAELAALTIHAS